MILRHRVCSAVVSVSLLLSTGCASRLSDIFGDFLCSRPFLRRGSYEWAVGEYLKDYTDIMRLKLRGRQYQSIERSQVEIWRFVLRIATQEKNI